MTEYAVILVYTTGHAIQAERALRAAGIEVRLIPTPRHLSSDCGSAVRIDVAQKADAEKTLEQAGVKTDRIVLLDS